MGSLVGISELARALGVAESTVRNHERRGLLPTAMRAGNRRYWQREDIEVFLASSRDYGTTAQSSLVVASPSGERR